MHAYRQVDDAKWMAIGHMYFSQLRETDAGGVFGGAQVGRIAGVDGLCARAVRRRGCEHSGLDLDWGRLRVTHSDFPWDFGTRNEHW
jgi:hypothetical protein